MNQNFRQPLGWQNITALLGAGVIGFVLFIGALILLWPVLLISAIYMAILRWKINRAMKKAAQSGHMSATSQTTYKSDGSYSKKVSVTVIDEDGNEL